jgi:hypothetical protein
MERKKLAKTIKKCLKTYRSRVIKEAQLLEHKKPVT